MTDHFATLRFRHLHKSRDEVRELTLRVADVGLGRVLC